MRTLDKEAQLSIGITGRPVGTGNPIPTWAAGPSLDAAGAPPGQLASPVRPPLHPPDSTRLPPFPSKVSAPIV